MTPSKFPTFSDYQSALQHPEIAFSTNFLTQGKVEIDLWGFPRVRSGGFALTYKIGLSDMVWAVRCFHRGVRDRASRYAQISRTLEEMQLPFFVPTRYFHHGIMINGISYPISVLKWIEGESLENYILHHLEEPETLNTLADNFRKVCIHLELTGIAHGDLSHRNIIIKSDDIFLIDYDGMFVPSLTNRKSCELGNIHFQHPLRNNHYFNCQLDRFSSIVIYQAIKALTTEPSLWQEFQFGGEGLLFQQSDFINPDESRLLRRLEKSDATSRTIKQFRQICLSPLEAIPSLEEFISGKARKPIAIPDIFQSMRVKPHNHPVYDAWSVDWIQKVAGQMATVIGRITEVFHGISKNGENHVFVNFGNWRNQCFTAVLWGHVLDDLNRYDVQIDSWPGQWMSVSGLISVINERSQIQIESITDLLPLESEVNARIQLESAVREGRYRKYSPVSSPQPPIIYKKTQVNSFQKQNTSDRPVTGLIEISKIFNKSRNPLIETTLNKLYSKDLFKDAPK